MNIKKHHICMGLSCALIFLFSTQANAHQGHTNAAPWHACKTKALNDSCHWENKKHDLYQGSCRTIGHALMCVRNQPIKYAHKPNHHTHTPQTSYTTIGFVLLGICACFGCGFFSLKKRTSSHQTSQSWMRNKEKAHLFHRWAFLYLQYQHINIASDTNISTYGE